MNAPRPIDWFQVGSILTGQAYAPRLSSVPLHELEETIKELGSEDLEAALFQHMLEERL